MFEQYCEFRDKEKDPNRYKNNRGCQMAKQLQEFNKVKKRLPKLEEQLLADIGEWESEHDKSFEIRVSCIDLIFALIFAIKICKLILH